MKLLVIGGSGLVGSHLLAAARSRGHEAIGTFRQHEGPGLVHLDLANVTTAETLLERERPDAVIHAAGWTWVDGCEDDPQRAQAENAGQPARLGRLCHARGIHFTYLSTSYVFDGREGPSDESAAPNPINVYGRSKLEGEQRVQKACGGAALLPRSICVYGVEARMKNFGYQVWHALREGKTLTVPSDQCGNTTYAGDMAGWLMPLIEGRQCGIRHLAGPKPDCTRTEWAEMLVRAFHALGRTPADGFNIVAVPTAQLGQKALRPLQAGLLDRLHVVRDRGATPVLEIVRRMMDSVP